MKPILTPQGLTPQIVSALTAADEVRCAIATSAMTGPGVCAALASDAAALGVGAAFRSIRSRFDVHVFDQVDSTSTQLWRMLEQGYGSGTVAIARQQSAGRGQRGRVWQSPPGGLYLSLAVEPDWAIAQAAQLTCLSAWGIATAFNNLGLPVQVKWPNDLFFENKKLGGILTETKVTYLPADAPGESESGKNGGKPAAYIKQAAIGVGINWHNPTPATGISLMKIMEGLPEHPIKNKINCLEMLAALVLRGIMQGVCFYQQVGGQVFMKDYAKLLIQFGKAVSLDREMLNRVVGEASQRRSLDKLLNRSGEVVGVSEEGYLAIALSGSSMEGPDDGSFIADGDGNILLLKHSAQEI